MKQTIYLIGFMGSGKTTLGRAAADAAGCPFVDLDDLIEQRAGRPISEIFATDGEAAFRRLEKETLTELSSSSPAIVACGGGTPCQPELMDLMLASGLVVWLEATLPRLTARLMEGRGKRPLIAAISSENEMEQFITRHLRHRHGAYARAHLRFPSDRLETADEIAQTVTTFLKITNGQPLNGQQPSRRI